MVFLVPRCYLNQPKYRENETRVIARSDEAVTLFYRDHI